MADVAMKYNPALLAMLRTTMTICALAEAPSAAINISEAG